jgi:hypothetical protein
VLSNSVLLASFLALLSVNTLDALLTRIALSNGEFEEKVSFTRRMIEELGLNGAMLVKSLLPIPFVIFIVLCWNYSLIGYLVSLFFFIIPTIWFSYVVSKDCIELWRNRKNKK